MRNIVALDFDALGNRIYWSDSSTNKIYSAYSNGTDTKVVGISVLNVQIFTVQ